MSHFKLASLSLNYFSIKIEKDKLVYIDCIEPLKIGLEGED